MKFLTWKNQDFTWKCLSEVSRCLKFGRTSDKEKFEHKTSGVLLQYNPILFRLVLAPKVYYMCARPSRCDWVVISSSLLLWPTYLSLSSQPSIFNQFCPPPIFSFISPQLFSFSPIIKYYLLNFPSKSFHSFQPPPHVLTQCYYPLLTYICLPPTLPPSCPTPSVSQVFEH